MDKKQMLLMAAKAYWGDEIDDVVSIEWCDIDGVLYTHADNQDHNGQDQTYVWNPLEDDGDALRLAVKVGMNMALVRGLMCIATVFDEEGVPLADAQQLHGDDPYAATRLAIVRAAAAIGEQSNG